MNCVYAAYAALVVGVVVGIGISWLMGAARRNWSGPETAREAIADFLRVNPGSSPERIADGACLTIETVQRELARMHEDGAVWMSHHHGSPDAGAWSGFHLVMRS